MDFSSNPIGGDNFQIARPFPGMGTPGGPKPHLPTQARPIPQVDELFAAQKALVKAINHLKDVRGDDPHVDRGLERAEAAYKRLRNWLAQYGNRGIA